MCPFLGEILTPFSRNASIEPFSLFLTCTHTLPPQLLLLPLAPGRAREEETPKWNPKMKPQGCIWLCIAWDCQGCNRTGVGFSSNTGVSQDSADLQKKKKKKINPQTGENRVDLQLQNSFAWPGAEIRLRAVTWWLSCCFLKDEQPRQLHWGIERNLCFGAASNLKPGIVLCIQPTHSEMFAPPCGASGTRWIPARNLLPSLNNEFFWGKPVQNKQRGILSATLHTFSISPQHLQETAGGCSILTEF